VGVETKYELIRVTITLTYSNINQFTLNSFLIKINSHKTNFVKINSSHLNITLSIMFNIWLIS